MVFGGLLLACGVSEPVWAVHWPEIQPKREVFQFNDPDRAVVRTIISDIKGRPLYLFACRTGEDRSVPDIIYVGDLDCRLLPAARGEVEDNLLLEEHGGKAWFSRGRMHAHELFGACGSYPEYGRTRHFRLRGMRLTLEFFDAEFAIVPPPRSAEPPSSRLKSYKLRFTVERDPSASRDIAESSGYLDPSREFQYPSRSCDVVQKGVEWPGK